MSRKFTPTPHDAVFKQFLDDKATAQDFLFQQNRGDSGEC